MIGRRPVTTPRSLTSLKHSLRLHLHCPATYGYPAVLTVEDPEGILAELLSCVLFFHLVASSLEYHS